jgi:hypothetical protein
VTDAVGGVEETQHAQLFACRQKALVWDAHAGHADYGVEDGNFDLSSSTLDFLELLLESINQPVVLNRVRVLHPRRLGRRGLSDVLHSSVTSLVNSRKIQDIIAIFVLQVAKDGVDAQSGIRNKSHGVTWCIEKFCNRGAGGVEVGWVLVADELVGTRFGGVLEGAEGGLDRAGVGAKGA